MFPNRRLAARCRSTVRDMTADPTPAPGPYLGPRASPAAIAGCLLPEDRERFHDALAAADRGSEAEHHVIERWRGITMLQSDPERYRATVRRIAERRTGRPVPADEPLSVTRRAAGMLRVYEVVLDLVEGQLAALPPAVHARVDELLGEIARRPHDGYVTGSTDDDIDRRGARDHGLDLRWPERCRPPRKRSSRPQGSQRSWTAPEPPAVRRRTTDLTTTAGPERGPAVADVPGHRRCGSGGIRTHGGQNPHALSRRAPLAARTRYRRPGYPGPAAIPSGG